jgi:hypothetical protein
MLSRADTFRRQAERSGPKKAPKPKPRRRDFPIDTSKPGVSASDRKAMRHEIKRIDKHQQATYALEDSATRPSRMTTRKSSNHQKTDVQFRLKARRAELVPGRKAHGR